MEADGDTLSLRETDGVKLRVSVGLAMMEQSLPTLSVRQMQTHPVL